MKHLIIFYFISTFFPSLNLTNPSIIGSSEEDIGDEEQRVSSDDFLSIFAIMKNYTKNLKTHKPEKLTFNTFVLVLSKFDCIEYKLKLTLHSFI